MACWNGPISALAAPCTVTSPTSAAGLARPAATSTASATAVAAAARLPMTSTGRRGSRSASAPPTGESRPIGRNPPAATSTAQVAFPVSEMTSAPTATVCIQEPIVEIRPAVHSSVNARCRNGCRAVRPRPGPGGGDPDGPVPPRSPGWAGLSSSAARLIPPTYRPESRDPGHPPARGRAPTGPRLSPPHRPLPAPHWCLPGLSWEHRFVGLPPYYPVRAIGSAGRRGRPPVARICPQLDRSLPAHAGAGQLHRVIPAQRGGQGWRPNIRTCVLGKLTSQFHRTYVLIPACLRSLALPDQGPSPPSPPRCWTWARPASPTRGRQASG